MTLRISGPAAAPVGALTLKPLSTHGLWLAVMTMPGGRAALDDLVRAHLGRHGVLRERDRDAVGEEDLGGRRGEVLGGEPPVEGDDDALGLLAAALRRSGPRRRRSAGRSRTCSRRRSAPASRRCRRRSSSGPAPPSCSSRQPPGSAQRSISSRTRPMSGAAPRRTAMGCVAVMLPRSERRDDPQPAVDAADTRSSSPTSTVSPGLTTAPSPRDPRAAEQRGPRAEVGPADVHRAHHDPAVARRALHHRVVDRERLADRFVGALEHGRRADHRADASGRGRCSARARRGSPGAATGTCRRSRPRRPRGRAARRAPGWASPRTRWSG